MKIKSNQTYHEITIRDKWQNFRNDKYRYYRRLWSESPLRQTVSEFPLHLDIETSTICNLRCPMCPRTYALAKKAFEEPGIMKFGDFKNIINQGIEGGVYSIKLNYLGEPLLHPDVIKQVKYAKEKGVIDVMFNTNGVMLSEDLSYALLEAGIDKLFLSFDSPYPESYEQIRVGAKFSQVLKNIRTFYNLKTRNYPHVQVRVSMVIMNDEPKVIKDFVKLFEDTVDAIGFDEYRDIEDRSVKPVVDGFICAQLYQRMFLRLNGNVCVCCADNRGEQIVGNWVREPLKEIWHGKQYTAIRQAHEKGCYHAIPLCSICTMPLAQENATERKFVSKEFAE